MPKIALGADHAGLSAKERIKQHLRQRHPNLQIEDCGTHGPESVDYPDYAHAVAAVVATGEAVWGVLVCGSGIGMCIAANRHAGIRAALCHDRDTARLARQHNDANILVVGGRILPEQTILEILDIFLTTEFEGGRHVGRLTKLELPESQKE